MTKYKLEWDKIYDVRRLFTTETDDEGKVIIYLAEFYDKEIAEYCLEQLNRREQQKEVFIVKNSSVDHIDIIGVFATHESAEKHTISKGFVRSGNHYKKPSTSIPYAKFVRVAWIQKYPVMSGSNNGELEDQKVDT